MLCRDFALPDPKYKTPFWQAVSQCDRPVPFANTYCLEHIEAWYAMVNTPISDIPDEREVRDRDNTTRPLPARHAEAVEYARTYSGDFEFMQQMRLTVERTGFRRLSDRQAEAIIKIIDREKARNVERKNNESGIDLFEAMPYGQTRVAVDNESGGVSFFIISKPDKRSLRWHGWVFVKQQQGPAEVKAGSQRPGESYVGLWPSLIEKVVRDVPGSVVRYGLELGICGVCSTPLTNDESRAKGIGPVCERKFES